MGRNSFCFLLFLLACSCHYQESFDSAAGMTQYVSTPDNGYKYTKSVNGVDFTLQYRPTDLLVVQELKNRKDSGEIQNLRNKYSRYLYFNLSMSMNGQELLNSTTNDKEKFGQMLSDLAFGMDAKVHLTTKSRDTIPMTDFVYPRMYGTTASTTIMLVYPRDEKILGSDSFNLTVEDLGLSTGNIKFKIDTKALINEPKINF